MKRTLLFAILLVAAVTANAIPAKPGKFRLATADGKTIEATLVGDEFHHNFVTTDGFIVRKVDGSDLYKVTDQKFDAVMATAERKQMAAKRNSIVSPKSAKSSATFSRGLVILVGFSDLAFTESNAAFTNLLNQQGYSYNGATGCAREYFNASSYGAYNPTFDVYGPYTLSHNESYYGANDYSGSDVRPDQMVVDAVAAMVAAVGADSLAKYDCDNDGYVDNVFVYYAGYAESSGASENTIWPHRWVVSSYNVSGNTSYTTSSGRKTIYDYACGSEYDGTSGATRTGVGTFTHEFSHVLGLPDLYDTEYSEDHCTPEDWDIMDVGCYNNDEKTPPLYSAEERFYVGWLTPTVLTSGTHTLNCLSDTAQAFLISSTGAHNLDGTNPNPKSYYLLENRQLRGWDSYIPGHGMVVWKVQYNRSNWEGNTVNNNVNSLGLIVVSAKNPTSTAYRSASGADPFPGTRNVTSYTPFTGCALSNISESNGIITFGANVTTGVDDLSQESDIVMFSFDGDSYTVDNIPEDAILRCYDATGRLVWSAQNVGSTYSFTTGNEAFFLQIQSNGHTTTLKGI